MEKTKEEIILVGRMVEEISEAHVEILRLKTRVALLESKQDAITETITNVVLNEIRRESILKGR